MPPHASAALDLFPGDTQGNHENGEKDDLGPIVWASLQRSASPLGNA